MQVLSAGCPNSTIESRGALRFEPPRAWLAISLATLALALISGCESSAATLSPLESTASTYAIALTARTTASLPNCVASLQGQVAYVSSPASLWKCMDGRWMSIPCNDGNTGSVAYSSTTELLVACINRAWLTVALPRGPEGPQGNPGPQGGAGPPGDAGPSGTDGMTTVVALMSFAGPRGPCASGGTEVQSGVDSNRSGALDPSEVSATAYVCNGAQGTTGANGAMGTAGPKGDAGPPGATSLIAITAEPDGAYCASGGVRIDTGIDANSNGHLDSSEIQNTAYVCNGTGDGALCNVATWKSLSPNLQGCVLVGADLTDADLRQADLTGANLLGANLGGAVLAGAKLSHANLTAANLTESSLPDADLTNANLARADLSFALLRNANFTDADLTGANFAGAYLLDADFAGTTVAFSGSCPGVLPSLAWKCVALTNGSNMNVLVGPGVRLNSLYLGGVDLTGADLTGADLGGAFTGNLLGACPAALPASDWKCVANASGKLALVGPAVSLYNVNLAGTSLTGANLAGAELNLTNFSGADLTNANLTNASLVETNFTGAKLAGANLTSAYWSSAICPDGTNSDDNGGHC